MATILSHKIRLDPTCKQQIYFAKACGIARFTWNWALSEWEKEYKENKKTNAFELKKKFNALKKVEFPWVYEVTKYASQQPFIHLQKGFQGFFSKRTNYPKYKKKGIHESFYIGGDQVQIIDKKVKIPNLGWVRLRECLRFEGKVTGVTISKTANYWFISVHVEISQKPPLCENQASVGVDLGIKNLATLSDGKTLSNPKPLKKQQKKLKRLQRKLSRRLKGSNNRFKIKQRIAKVYYKIKNVRSDTLHKLTTQLTTDYKHIVIEELDISNMVKSHRLASSILEGSWYEFRRQLTYKANLKGNIIYIADQWYASSKLCSTCNNHKEDLQLSERIYLCDTCQIKIDRDLNAAINLKNLLNTVSSTEIDACRQDGNVIMLKALKQPAWKKQELSPV